MRSALSLLFVAGAAAWLPAHRNLFDKGSKCQPGTDKVRGVNLGSLFVVEPWMIQTEWASMGCNGTNSEHDCVEALGQDAANAAFWEHWTNWFTDEDLDLMVYFGLNSLRIPLGFWMLEHLVNPDEHFPLPPIPGPVTPSGKSFD